MSGIVGGKNHRGSGLIADLGTDGQLLTSAGAGSRQIFEDAAGGGAWTLLQSSVASNTASISYTGISTTYATYAIIFSDIKPVDDGETINLRLGDSGGIDSGASDYNYLYDNTGTNDSNNQYYYSYANTGYNAIVICAGIGNATGETGGGVVYLQNHAVGHPQMHGTFAVKANTGAGRFGTSGGMRLAVITVTQVQLYMAGGNIDSGRISFYGIAHA